MSFVLEKEWITKAGFLARAGMVNESHRCGYVAVGPDHPLFGVNYNEETDVLIPPDENETVGKRSPIILLSLSFGGPLTVPDVVMDVHGGLTYSEQDENDPNLWWFGFDCAHAGDLTMTHIKHDFTEGEFRSLEYVIEECESLAEQLITKVKFQKEIGNE